MLDIASILAAGSVEIIEEAQLVIVNSVATAENGSTYLKCTGLSATENGAVSKLVVNVYPAMTELESIEEALEVSSSHMLLVFGEMSVKDTDYGNVVRSVGQARFARYNSKGVFSLDDVEKTGEAGALVLTEINRKAVLTQMDEVTNRPATRKTVELKARHSRRTMEAATPEAVPAGATATA